MFCHHISPIQKYCIGIWQALEAASFPSLSEGFKICFGKDSTTNHEDFQYQKFIFL
jgi:hypothetical protein